MEDISHTSEKIPKTAEGVRTIHSYISLILELPPSCLEFSPIHPEFFVVGTYSLDNTGENQSRGSNSSGQTRSGSLLLFELHGTNIALRGTLLTPDAILDLHFSPRDGDCFAVATSTGSIDGYCLSLQNERKIQQLNSYQVCNSSILVLSFTWYTNPMSSKETSESKGNTKAIDVKKERHRKKKKPATHLGDMGLPIQSRITRLTSSPEDDASAIDLEEDEADALSDEEIVVAFSLSNGQVGYIATADQQLISKVGQAHSLEAWTVAWSSLADDDSVRTLYSGGDDSAFCRNNPRLIGAGAEYGPYQHMSRDIKSHEAGVTAVLPIPIKITGTEVVLTGSYDEHIRVLAFPLDSKKPKLLAEQRLQGGVWRIKIQGSIRSDDRGSMSFRVLASCMHAGTRVVEIECSEDRAWSIRVVAQFTEHESMNYASDSRQSLPLSGENPGMTAVSASFYDRKLCVWNIPIP